MDVEAEGMIYTLTQTLLLILAILTRKKEKLSQSLFGGAVFMLVFVPLMQGWWGIIGQNITGTVLGLLSIWMVSLMAMWVWPDALKNWGAFFRRLRGRKR